MPAPSRTIRVIAIIASVLAPIVAWVCAAAVLLLVWWLCLSQGWLGLIFDPLDPAQRDRLAAAWSSGRLVIADESTLIFMVTLLAGPIAAFALAAVFAARCSNAVRTVLIKPLHWWLARSTDKAASHASTPSAGPVLPPSNPAAPTTARVQAAPGAVGAALPPDAASSPAVHGLAPTPPAAASADPAQAQADAEAATLSAEEEVLRMCHAVAAERQRALAASTQQAIADDMAQKAARQRGEAADDEDSGSRVIADARVLISQLGYRVLRPTPKIADPAAPPVHLVAVARHRVILVYVMMVGAPSECDELAGVWRLSTASGEVAANSPALELGAFADELQGVLNHPNRPADNQCSVRSVLLHYGAPVTIPEASAAVLASYGVVVADLGAYDVVGQLQDRLGFAAGEPSAEWQQRVAEVLLAPSLVGSIDAEALVHS